MNIDKKKIGLIAGIVCVVLLIVALLTMCGGSNDENAPDNSTGTSATPTETMATAAETTAETTESTEETTEATEETTEATEETTAPTTGGSSSSGGSSTPGGSGGYNPGLDDPDDNTGSGSATEPLEISDPGTEGNPYMVTVTEIPAVTTTVMIPKTSPVHHVVNGAKRTVLTIEDADAYVVYNEKTYNADENGIVSVALATAEDEAFLSFQVGSNSETEKSYTLNFTEPVGSKANPEKLEAIDIIQVKLEAEEADGYYYQWTAGEPGTLTFAVEKITENVACDILVTVGETTVKLSESEDETVSVDLLQGDAVTIQVIALADAEGKYPAAEITIAGSFASSLGTEENPILITDLATPYEAKVASGKTVYYSGYVYEMIMTIENANGASVLLNGTEYAAGADGVLTLEFPASESLGRPDPLVFAVSNSAETDAVYTMSFVNRIGHLMNPAEMIIGENTAVLEAGDIDGYYFTWTAEEDGEVTIRVNTDQSVNGWSYVINNLTAGTYGETYTSSDETLVSSLTSTVTAGDELQVIVNTHDAANPYSAPAGEVVIELALGEPVPELGSEENPIAIDASVPYQAEIAAGKTVYYSGYFYEMTLSMSNAAGGSVMLNSMSYGANADGVITVTFPAAEGMGRPMPLVIAVTNGTAADAVYTMAFAYPEGHMTNPKELAEGENAVSIAAGDSDGYFYSWTAGESGTLTIAVDTEKTAEGWSFVVNNMTAGTFGDTNSSDNDPLITSQTIAVAAGDEVQVNVNTYNPAEPWSAPAGNVVIDVTFLPDAVEMGTEENPHVIGDTSVPYKTSMAAWKTVYYTGMFYDLTLTMENASGAVVTLDGVQYRADENGVLTVAFPSADGLEWPFPKQVFTITNNYESIVSYTLNFAFPVGHNGNPAKLVMDENTAKLKTPNEPYYFSWTAESSGKLIITMPEDQEWGLRLYNETAMHEDLHTSDGIGTNPASLEVEAGDKVIISVSSGADPVADIVFQATFEPGQLTFEAQETILAEGSNEITVAGRAGTVYAFAFEPDKVGTYTITTSDPAAKLYYCGGSAWFLNNYNSDENYDPATNTLTVDAIEGSIGASYYIGVSGVTECMVSITWSELAVNQVEETIYESEVAPTPFTLSLGENQELVMVDVMDTSVKYEAVLNEKDGFYHLNSENGPILYVDLSDGTYISMSGMLGNTAVRVYEYDASGELVSKINYTDCLLEYIECADEKTGVYPLTEDLMQIYQQYGEGAGWYDSDTTSGYYLFGTESVNEESAWMFACCYISTVETTAEPAAQTVEETAETTQPVTEPAAQENLDGGNESKTGEETVPNVTENAQPATAAETVQTEPKSKADSTI